MITLSIVISLFVVQLAVELPEDVGNSFPRCHRFSFFILRFECLFPCGFDLRYVLDPTELLKDLMYRLFPFCFCFVPDALLDPLAHLLQLLLVFSRDGPSFFDESFDFVVTAFCFFASTSCCSFIRPSFRLSLRFCCFQLPSVLVLLPRLLVCIRRCCFSLSASFSVCFCLCCFISFLLLCGCCGFCSVLS